MAHISPLHERHLQAEASMRPYGPLGLHIELVDSFGELDFEYAALRKSCVLLDQPHRGTIEVTGDDRHEFLNSMLTQQIKGLGAFRSTPSFWLNKQGRILADLRVLELGDRVLIDLDAHAVDATVESLAGYIITEDVELNDLSDRLHRLALHGPSAIELLIAASTHKEGAPLSDLTSGAACRVDVAGREVIVERFDTAGEVGLELTVDTDAAASVYARLIELGQPHDGDEPGSVAGRVKLRPAGWLAYNTARIEAGTPLFYIDFSPESLPAETGLLSSRVCFTKGCYLGQEIVARMHNLGKPKQRLVAFKPGGDELRGPDGLARQPVGGARVFPAGVEQADPVGIVTSSTTSPMLGGVPACFAIVKGQHADPGTPLAVHAEGVVLTGEVLDRLAFYERT
ncbi:MAG: aminomethyl transferase family protein [Phycisphaeraceae bacterium]|nr:MAG: aminomethyl transferase family protein [Phycisphaeraceae bacterium]